jgi:hypothetical protein
MAVIAPSVIPAFAEMTGDDFCRIFEFDKRVAEKYSDAPN